MTKQGSKWEQANRRHKVLRSSSRMQTFTRMSLDQRKRIRALERETNTFPTDLEGFSDMRATELIDYLSGLPKEEI